MLAALDKPTEGEVYLDGKPLSAIREKDLSKFRRDHLGFVFQDFNLLDTFNLKDNILLPLVLQGVDYRKMNVRMMPIVKELGIAGLLEKYPYEVSGDELLGVFERINQSGQTILMVTHSVKAASKAGRVLFIKDGEVFHQVYKGEQTDEQFYQNISATLTMLATGGERR